MATLNKSTNVQTQSTGRLTRLACREKRSAFAPTLANCGWRAELITLLVAPRRPSSSNFRLSYNGYRDVANDNQPRRRRRLEAFSGDFGQSDRREGVAGRGGGLLLGIRLRSGGATTTSRDRPRRRDSRSVEPRRSPRIVSPLVSSASRPRNNIAHPRSR